MPNETRKPGSDWERGCGEISPRGERGECVLPRRRGAAGAIEHGSPAAGRRAAQSTRSTWKSSTGLEGPTGTPISSNSGYAARMSAPSIGTS